MTIINILALLFTCRQLLYVQGQDIYCNDVPLNWTEAIENCQNDGGMPVPFNISDGRTLVDIGLRNDLYVWTADFSERQRVFGNHMSDGKNRITEDHECHFTNETSYECEYVNVSPSRTKSFGYDDCFSSKRNVCCKQNNICYPETMYVTWDGANKICGFMCDEKAYNTEGSYWVNFVYQIVYSYVSEKNITDVLQDQLRSCGVFKGNSNTLTYRPCDSENIKSLCKFSIDASVPDHYTRSCLNSSASQTLANFSTSNSSIRTGENQSLATGDNGLKIGLPVAILVIAGAILTVVAVVYWKRRKRAERERNAERSEESMNEYAAIDNSLRAETTYEKINFSSRKITGNEEHNMEASASKNSDNPVTENASDYYVSIDISR